MKKRILLVDDELFIINSLSRILSVMDIIIDSTTSPTHALDLIKENNYDIIISDQNMPEIMGTELLAKAQELQPLSKRIILSGYADFESITEAFNNHVLDHFMSKPWNNDEIYDVLYKLLNKESNEYPSDPDSKLTSFNGILTQSDNMISLFKKIKKASLANVPIFIHGETGVGKELIAQAIHHEGSRKEQNFIAFNCSNFSDTLMESQLFGHKKGSFTGAVKDFNGLLSEAGHGTLFLDETTTLPLHLQSKLLRVLQERKYSQVGSFELLDFNAQIVAASSVSLSDAVETGDFRADLRYRLEVILLDVPPLRSRQGDALFLFKNFISNIRGNDNFELSKETETLVANYSWPGNVRQCQNARAVPSEVLSQN